MSPGVRANNYYDNFRSYSRQNRLSGGPPANLRGEGEPANNLPTSRPRRKYKINREQNRCEEGLKLETDQLLTCREQSRADPTLAANTYTSPTSDPGPSVDNLTKNIYSQVGSLISAQVYCNCLHSREMDTWQLSGKNPSKPSSPASLLDSTWQQGSQ